VTDKAVNTDIVMPRSNDAQKRLWKGDVGATRDHPPSKLRQVRSSSIEVKKVRQDGKSGPALWTRRTTLGDPDEVKTDVRSLPTVRSSVRLRLASGTLSTRVLFLLQ